MKYAQVSMKSYYKSSDMKWYPRIAEWPESLLPWRTLQADCVLIFAPFRTKIIQTEFEPMSQTDCLIVRTNEYPLWWMWIWVRYHTERVKDKLLWGVGKFLYDRGLLLPETGRYATWRDLWVFKRKRS